MAVGKGVFDGAMVHVGEGAEVFVNVGWGVRVEVFVGGMVAVGGGVRVLVGTVAVG